MFISTWYSYMHVCLYPYIEEKRDYIWTLMRIYVSYPSLKQFSLVLPSAECVLQPLSKRDVYNISFPKERLYGHTYISCIYTHACLYPIFWDTSLQSPECALSLLLRLFIYTPVTMYISSLLLSVWIHTYMRIYVSFRWLYLFAYAPYIVYISTYVSHISYTFFCIYIIYLIYVSFRWLYIFAFVFVDYTYLHLQHTSCTCPRMYHTPFIHPCTRIIHLKYISFRSLHMFAYVSFRWLYIFAYLSFLRVHVRICITHLSYISAHVSYILYICTISFTKHLYNTPRRSYHERGLFPPSLSLSLSLSLKFTHTPSPVRALCFFLCLALVFSFSLS